MQHLKIIGYVDLAARLGSIRKAAEQLHIASTAVNRSILALERELGTPLFERLPRGVRLTAAGELFVAHARNTASDYDRVRSEIEALRGLRRGTIKIGAIEAVAPAWLPDLVATFQQRHPGVQFQVHVDGSEGIVTALVGDGIEVGITFNAPVHPDVQIVASCQQRLLAVLAKDHPLAGRDSVRPHECAEYPIALAEPSRGGRQVVDGMLRRNDLRVVPALVSNSFELMEAYCLRRNAVFFQLAVAATRTELSSTLFAIPVSDKNLSGVLALCVHRGRQLNVAASAFVERARETMTALGDRP